MDARLLPWRSSPLEVLRRWPAHLPLAALLSAPRDPEARWSIFGLGARWATELPAFEPLPRHPDAPPAPPADAAIAEPTFRSGWIGVLSYELGAAFEPASLRERRRLPGVPLVAGWRCDGALVHDAISGRWWLTGGCGEPELLPPDAPMEPCRLGRISPESTPQEYRRAVSRCVELIHAGDLFQANVAQRFTATVEGSLRTLAVAALEAAQPRYGAVVELPDGGAVVSMSPELFLEVEPRSRRVRSRPIKGTLPAGRPVEELLRSGKDAAELHMIVDLVRNDLGRVCRTGSVRVVCPRRMESHPTVHHGVAEVEGVLRPEVDVTSLLAATFPPGSVTGAPKIRAMQVIESLEAFPRGPYCGAVGFVDLRGGAALNVAIRTIVVPPAAPGLPRQALYAAGCGIVADSLPEAELAESLQKMEVLRLAAARLGRVQSVRRRGAAAAPGAHPRRSRSAPPPWPGGQG